MNAREKILSKLEELGERTLKADLERRSYRTFSYKILLLFFTDVEMLLTFICGFVANLPVSVLFNILTLNDVDICNMAWIIYFVIYVVCFISTIVLTIFVFAITIRYVKIKTGKKIPERIRDCIIQNGKKTALGYLKWRCVWIIISSLIFVLSVITLFAVNTFLLE